MEVTFVDVTKMKSLEDYAISLVTGMVSLKTLENYHIRAYELGLFKEDHECRCNTIVWDLRRMIKLYQDQLESILELLPPEFQIEEAIEVFKKAELTKARQLTRKKKDKS